MHMTTKIQLTNVIIPMIMGENMENIRTIILPMIKTTIPTDMKSEALPSRQW